MSERSGAVTFKGSPLTLVGTEVKVGKPMPEFEVVDGTMKAVKGSSFKGKICVITALPSLDTGTCDLMAKRFNSEAAKLGSSVQVLTISMDLPFAQSRWCAATGASNLQVLSDHKEGNFGKAFGILIKEWRMLARAAFVVDAQGIVRYCQIVKEVSEQPNYDDVLREVKELAKEKVSR